MGAWMVLVQIHDSIVPRMKKKGEKYMLYI